MLRKLLLTAVAVVMPIGIVAATAGTASAGVTTDPTGAPATASCALSGGSLKFKVPIGIVTAGGYQAPTKNKGNQITVAGVTLTCTSSAVSGSFTGSASGKIKTANPSETPTQFYGCTSLVGVSPGPGGTLSGSLKVKWSVPAGQKFSAGKTTTIGISSILGGVNGGGDGTFTIPGNPGTGSLTGSFPGSDAGASSNSTDATAQTEATLAGLCTAVAGLSTITLGAGSASLK